MNDSPSLCQYSCIFKRMLIQNASWVGEQNPFWELVGRNLWFFFFFFNGCAQSTHRSSQARVESSCSLPAYTTATAMPDLSGTCDLHHSLRQWQILTHWVTRDWTRILMDTHEILNLLSHNGNSETCVFKARCPKLHLIPSYTSGCVSVSMFSHWATPSDWEQLRWLCVNLAWGPPAFLLVSSPVAS